ncbi:hypothetical protein CKO51_17695 [Rhodopirellula sp. SM50]|nr:hypothetical protein CKO51_17695 [Rhodopirellula sp. SM50]
MTLAMVAVLAIAVTLARALAASSGNGEIVALSSYEKSPDGVNRVPCEPRRGHQVSRCQADRAFEGRKPPAEMKVSKKSTFQRVFEAQLGAHPDCRVD